MSQKLALAIVLIIGVTSAMAEEWNTPESKARWEELGHAVFGANARFEKTDSIVAIEAPGTAQDAALVPVTLKVASQAKLKELDLIIDQNPSPVAAKIKFGPAGDPRQMKLRVRVDGFTNMHAVAATEDGKLLQTVTYVQGSGGCSAPVGGSEEEASAHIGEMRMKFATNSGFGAPQATLMIRHPNFNGMQVNQATHKFTPPRYIRAIAVTRGDESVFSMATDISLSTNPVIEFLYRGDGTKPFKVTVTDSTNSTWTQQFDARPPVN